MSIGKYFWDLSPAALNKTPVILKDPGHPQFIPRLAALLSRCDRPREIFANVDRKVFVSSWPSVRKYWKKTARALDFLAWWETVYEEMAKVRRKDVSAGTLSDIGKEMRALRIKKGLSQKDVSNLTGITQADISRFERGHNMELMSLLRILKALKAGEFSFKIRE